MKFLNKLERKFGKYAIPNLINYFLVFYVAGTIIGLFNPYIYYSFLSLDVEKILHGQIWRLVTFIMEPYSLNSIFSIIFFFFTLNIYFMFGHSLENVWGTFRFNLFFFSGVLLNIIAAFLVYFIAGWSYPIGLSYIYQAMFFSFALIFPDTQFLIYGILPIKVKWLAILDAVLLGISFIQYLLAGYFVFAIAMIVAMLNFFVFYLVTRNYKRISPKEIHRRQKFHSEMKHANGITRHKCAICGRTEQDDPTLEFRFCSKCDGNYEYCQEHLFTHEHVKRH